jgi:hypothetical protein
MALMRRRADEIGADVVYTPSSPEGGTTVAIRLKPHRPVAVALINGLLTTSTSPVPTAGGQPTRLCYEAIIRRWVNPNLLLEEDATVREAIKNSLPASDRLYVDPDWLASGS